jgi:hypothetical protein
VVEILKQTLNIYRKTAIKPGNKKSDPRASPKLSKFVWTNWMNFVESNDETTSKPEAKKNMTKPEETVSKMGTKLPRHFNDQFILSLLSRHKEIRHLNV